MVKIKKSSLKVTAVAVEPVRSDADMRIFLEHAIHEDIDSYLRKLAMTVVQLKSFSEISVLQSDLLKEKDRLAQKSELLDQAEVEIWMANEQLIVDSKKVKELREALLQTKNEIYNEDLYPAKKVAVKKVAAKKVTAKKIENKKVVAGISGGGLKFEKSWF